MFKALGRPVHQGRALWALSAARSGQGRVAEADRAAREALALARRERRSVRHRQRAQHAHVPRGRPRGVHAPAAQALAAFREAGYVERQAVVTHNLGNLYGKLGLYRRARRLLRQAADSYRRAGAVGAGLATTHWMLAHREHELGRSRRGKAPSSMEAAARWEVRGHRARGCLWVRGIRPACAVGRQRRGLALRIYEEAARSVERTRTNSRSQINALTGLSEAYQARRQCPRGAGGIGARHRDPSRARSRRHPGHRRRPRLWWHHSRRAAGQRQGRGSAAGASHRVPIPGRAHPQAHRRGTAAQLPQQTRDPPQDRRGVGCRNASAPTRAAQVPRTSPASRRCASLSSGWSTPACA